MRMRNSWSSLAVPFALFALVAATPLNAARALTAPVQLGELEEADRKALETIASHDERLRDAVLEASLHIDELVETQRIQEQSSASFQERIAKLDKKQQEQVWEIVREPGLLDELASEDPPSSSELDEIAARHPESLAPAIRTFGTKHHDVLVDVARIHHRARERFDVAISDLDADTQQVFRDLVDQPELLSVLVHRVNLVVRLGDSYRKNPNDTRKYLTALAADVAKRNAAAEEEWKRRIESDPKAAEEAAREYSEENGYDYDELTSPEARTRVNVVVQPYPYWFGYPYWYSNAYLYPYGYWYPYRPYFGYYHYYNDYVWWGVPPFPFVHWFYWGHHHHHYSHAHNCFNRHFSDNRFAPTHRNRAASDFIARSERVGQPGDSSSVGRSRGNGSMSVDRSIGASGTEARYAGRDRGFFFNRTRSPAMEQRRGFDQANGRGRDARAGLRAPQTNPKSQAGQSPGVRGGRDRGRAIDQPSGGQGSRGRNSREWSHAPRAVDREQEWSHAPRVVREDPQAKQSAPSGGEPRSGGRRSGERGSAQSGESGGGDAPVAHGNDGGGQNRGGDASSVRGNRGYGGSSARGYSGSSRGRSYGSSGGSRGGSRSGGFGGGSWGGGGFGGGSRGGGGGGGGRGR
jgi:hypothetical protein